MCKDGRVTSAVSCIKEVEFRENFRMLVRIFYPLGNFTGTFLVTLTPNSIISAIHFVKKKEKN